MDVCGRQVYNTTQNLAISHCGLEALPTEFGQLTQLTTLDLGSNSLEQLPTEFGQLAQLTSLDLSGNSLAALPTEFGQLAQLTTLDLQWGTILAALPTEFGQLTQLRTLHLRENRLTALPSEFGQLAQLTTLDLRSNNLAALPTEFGQLAQLTTLDLALNSLAALPTEFGQLAQLTTLNLQWNSLAVLPTEFGQLAQLTTLGLRSNRLAALPTEFGQLTRLTSLDFRWNSLAALPTEFGQLARLNDLDLRENSLAALPTEFSQLAQLTTLDLNSNSLAALPTEFGQLAQLTTLDLNSNSLAALPTEFGQLAQLTRLDLFWNSLAALPTEFGQLAQLNDLDLNSNSLVAIPTEFGQLAQLTRLDLQSNTRLDLFGNRLAALPTEFGQLTQLNDLDLLGNRLAALPTEFGQLAQLTSLRLSKNSLAALPTEFGQLAQLVSLHLHSNRLAALPTEFGQLAPRLAWLNDAGLHDLDLHSNSLAALPTEFGQLTQLTTLDLGSNSLEQLPTEFGQLTQLTTLDLGSNSLEQLPTEFGQLTQLTTLDLEWNSLVTLPFPPTHLLVAIVRSASIDMKWSAPTLPLVSIEYQVNVTSSGVTVPFSSPNNQIGMNLLEKFGALGTPHRSYVIQVMAKFRGGYNSSWSNLLNVTTCAASMEREDTNDVDACYALAGFYRAQSGLARSCTVLERDLPPGALGQCSKARLRIVDLPIQEDFWRASLSSEDIRLCPAVKFCTQQSYSSSLTLTDRYCAPYHSGTYCSDCVDNYVLGASGCTFCTEEARESTGQLVMLVVTFLLIVVVLYVYVLYSAGCLTKNLCCKHGFRTHKSPLCTAGCFNKKNLLCCSRNSRKQAARPSSLCTRCNALSGKGLIWTKVRILFGYFQVLSSYRRTFLKQSLAESGDLLGVVAMLSNVDLTWLVGNAAFRCFYDYNHYDLLLAATLSPIVLAVLLFACTTGTAYCMVRRLLKPVRHHTESALLLLLFLIYPYVSQIVFGTFWCESFPDADRRFNLTTSALRADYRLSCERDMDNQRLGVEIYAGVMVVVYPVGVVALYSWVLYVHKDRVMAFGNNGTTKEMKEKLTKVSFLIKPYKVERYWFEAYELVRKLLQTSLVGFLAGLPIEREVPGYLASISLSLTVVFVLSLALLQPYKHRSDFAFAVMSLLLLLPASLYSLLDPYARHEGISNSGLEALVITELCVFALFVVFEVGRGMSAVGGVKDGLCGNSCLKEGGGVETQEVDESCDGDQQANDGIPLVAKKQIAELAASLEFFKAENERLHEKVSLIHPADEEVIQPL